MRVYQFRHIRAEEPHSSRGIPGSAHAASIASASSAGVSFTRRMIFTSLPSGPMMNVERSTPMYFRPAKLFSTQTP